MILLFITIEYRCEEEEALYELYLLSFRTADLIFPSAGKSSMFHLQKEKQRESESVD